MNAFFSKLQQSLPLFTLVSLAATSSLALQPASACTSSTQNSSQGTAVAASPDSSDELMESTGPNLVEIAASSESFTTLTAAIEAADLVEVLSGETAYTVFAPTNEAFAALPEGTLETLLKPENRDQLVQILTYHVVPGSVTSDQLSSGMVATAAGPNIDVAIGDSTLTINQASVLQADIPASNGVIHVIDQVLLPPASNE
ncbi:MAG: fasciclin domain-containing protein [Cyanobacteria bacterium P01_D01_bin.36]